MSGKQVSIARHNHFYKVFFTKHKEILESFINLTFADLNEGYKNLSVFYGSYSYYLKDDEFDDDLKKILFDRQSRFREDNEYWRLREKVSRVGIKGLTYEELIQSNQKFHLYMQDIFEIFEIFIHRLAPADLLPSLSENHDENERTIVYVIYDTFYECLFNIHAKIDDKLMNFSILDFRETIQIVMVFFYGYSYYLERDTRKELLSELSKLFEYYNNREFMSLYMRILNGKISDNDYEKAKETRKDIFNLCLYIFEKVNNDLPKSNLFPKKSEKVYVDTTLI